MTDVLREVAKIPTLGISYCLTPFGFVRQIEEKLGIKYEIDEAEAFFEAFFEMFPEIAAYQTKAAEDALNAESVRTIGETRRYLPRSSMIAAPVITGRLSSDGSGSWSIRRSKVLAPI